MRPRAGSQASPPIRHSITINSGSLPVDAGQTLAGSSATTGSSCTLGSGTTTTTSGSGTTEEYVTECALAATPTPADASGGPTYPINFTATGPGGDGGTAAASGNLNITVAADTVTCIDPASTGTTVTFAEGARATYQVECEAQSGISGVTAYPNSITINSGGLPADAGQTLAGSSATTGSSCTLGTGTTTTTSGSGTTEEYVTECALSADTTAADASGGPTYPTNFTASGPSGDGGTTAPSGTLTITAATAKAESCIDPVSTGTTTTFGSSPGGTNNSYTVECEAESGASGVTAYPASISITAGSLPGTQNDASFAGVSGATTCNLGSGTTTTTSGSGTTEEYVTECALTEDAVTADNGTYTANFTPSTLPPTQSGTLTVNVNGPADVCLDPAGAGTTTTFREGIANSYTVECYGTGFTSASANNYPASITANDVTPAAPFLDGTAHFGGDTDPTTHDLYHLGVGRHHHHVGLGAHRGVHPRVHASPTRPTNTEGGAYAATFTAAPGIRTAATPSRRAP